MQLIDAHNPAREKKDGVSVPRFAWYVIVNGNLYGCNSFIDSMLFSIKYNACYLESASHPNTEYL